MSRECKPDTPPEGAIPQAGEARVVDSHTLLPSDGELLIRHQGRIYRLRRTRFGKLILTA